MTDSKDTAGLTAWSVPECPFTIEYLPRALDDIRLAVMDAFFSLPRGGAEIGGILCGDWDGTRLMITDYAALQCEHAFGPSFALSPRDEGQLAGLLAGSAAKGLRPVGWYHSHTRSEIFLSDADQEIHRRFFPKPWQVALVLKPHTFHPARAGFFFRDAGGALHAKASPAEFVLAPLEVRAAPSGARAKVEPEPLPDAVPEPMPFWQSEAMPESTAAVESQESAAAPASPPELPRVAARPSRSWPIVVAGMVFGCCALGAIAYWERELWMPNAMAMAQRAPAPALPPAMGLYAIDSNGQLQIRWDRNSPAVQRATGGILSIGTGGPSRLEIPLDKEHLLSGAFTFARQTARVDVSLGVTQAGGRSLREVTTFLGKQPDEQAAEDPAVRKERDNLAKQVAKMQADLNAEGARNARLQRSIDQLSKQLRSQQRSRLLNQSRDKR